MNPKLKNKIKIILIRLKVKNEASTTGTGPVASGPVAVGGDAARTPFAFSKTGARPTTYTQLGYKLAKRVKRSPYKLENQMYEGFNGLKYEQENQVTPQQTTQPPPQQSPIPTPQSKTTPPVDIKSYDVLPDFTAFDTKLKNGTEVLKNNLQKTIQDKILGKKVVVRASKGYKQPETDYTINVTGVAIDYYYDRYVIIIIGREENKQKVSKFFIKTGFKVKIFGAADNLKPKDKYQVAKSKALVEPQQSTVATNTITSDEDETTSEPVADAAQQSPKQQKP